MKDGKDDAMNGAMTNVGFSVLLLLAISAKATMPYEFEDGQAMIGQEMDDRYAAFGVTLANQYGRAQGWRRACRGCWGTWRLKLQTIAAAA